MSRLFVKLSALFSSRNRVGIDKAGNRYFTRKEVVDGIMKEKRWVIFKGDQDPTSIPVEWICWLNGQRKKAPTPEEIVELEAKRERVKQNVAYNVISRNNFLLWKRESKKEEEEKRLVDAGFHQSRTIGKGVSPDLKSFIKQFPGTSYNQNRGSEDASDTMGDDKSKEKRPSEPTGSGTSFKPGTWQPPT